MPQAQGRDVRLLFYKTDLAWPRISGHDVHAFNMMRAMSRLGARIGLVTLRAPSRDAASGLDLEMSVTLGESDVSPNGDVSPLSGLEERYRSYWGVDTRHIQTVGLMAKRFGAEAVVVIGLDALPMLGAV